MKTIVLYLFLAGALAAPSRRIRFREGNYKIVGGTNATLGEFPYMLSYQDISYGVNFHLCGASIYNENWAITAGHCVYGEKYDNPDYLRVVAGELNLEKDEGTEQGIVLSKLILHENFDDFNLYNDIGLLKLSEPLNFNEYVSAIDLPEREYTATGDCILTGWGSLSENGKSPDILQKVTIPIMTDEKCRADYSQTDILDNMICAGYEGGGKDACQGDSGGPMACNDTGSTYLAGIVSWGAGCARPHAPGVYTEVSHFIDWIEKHTR
ncbi:trypsin-1-like [Homarus americanus]|uniref:Trypsin-1-like 5 n=1 Tax=Homarus americanus TaxID=6706 RepID=A0A8J5K1C4_HOMAM|nr:trypsin-1-like [Homarus americanus]KAG7165584.1 Trypsin-1-like 5 [Homarus americanus]